MSIEEIARRSGCETSLQLYDVMRVLARCGIGKELENKHFTKNDGMELLRRDQGPSLGHMFGYFASDELIRSLSSLGAAVKQGKPAFVLEHGMTHFTYMSDLERRYDPSKMSEGTSIHKIGSDERRGELANNYHNGMKYYTYLTTLPNVPDIKNVYNVFPWSTCNKLADIGGSSGIFLASILKLPGCEHVKGYVIDYSETVEKAKANVQDLGISERRILFAGHDFTKPFPSELCLQFDTIVFKNTFGMYLGDESLSRKTLSNCCNLFPSSGGRLLIIDSAIPDDKDPDIGINGFELGTHSLHRMSVMGTPFLTKNEWKQRLLVLGSEMGYQVVKVYDTFHGCSTIIELSWNPKIESARA